MVEMRILSIRTWLRAVRALRLAPGARRRPGPYLGGGAVALALLTAACSSGPATDQAAQTASQARAPVAREYWNVLSALQPVLSPKLGPGNGAFSACPASSGQPSQVSYNVTTDAVAANGNLSTSQFVTELEQHLQSHGWGGFTASGSSTVSGNGQFRVYLRPQTGNLAFAVVLTVAGPCVTTGTTFASQVDGINGSLHDEYPYAQLSARPVPTAPLPSP
jgi:hypothetical protein